MAASGKLRIDKWLWAVRIFKTRSLAQEACLSGKVKVADQRIKPAKMIVVGDIITVRKGILTRTLKVTGLLEKRGSATVAADHVEDLTPPEEKMKFKSVFANPVLPRKKGAGRPTKKQRRMLDKLRREL
ncbi:MAG: RNA-binding S4 domain-containing protein [FCB group bacterium]|nr:RNA-binding S4 domain-containing protein [FCB group bacterium]